MAQAANDGWQRGGGTEEARGKNMRQVLLRAARIVNRHVVEGLHARGYSNLRSTHTTLLSNMPLAGGKITEVAERAGITKQAMGRLAADLEKAGYIRIAGDPEDGRARTLQLTKAGRKLMLDSFDVMAELERHYAKLVGPTRLRAILRGLTAFNDLIGGPTRSIIKS
jgi:DNA-binding MarR family transcriptional regulator